MKKPYTKPAIITYDAIASEHRSSTNGTEECQPKERSYVRSCHDVRRHTVRYPFSANAFILEPTSQNCRTAKISEISADGCYVEGLEEFDQSTVIWIVILGSRGQFETWATVAYFQSTGSEVRFCDTQPTQQNIVDDWIAKLEASLD